MQLHRHFATDLFSWIFNAISAPKTSSCHSADHGGMDQRLADASRGQSGDSNWEPRFRHLIEDGGSDILAQHNFDSSTRSKITHIEFFGLGLVGSVCSVTYGTWSNTPAAILVMQFDFRAGDGFLRYKKAEVSISFEPQSTTDVYPAVRRFFPTTNRVRGKLSELEGSTLSSGYLVWPPDEFVIRGRSWYGKDSQDQNEVFWTLNDTCGAKFGICEPIKLAVVVTAHEPSRPQLPRQPLLGWA